MVDYGSLLPQPADPKFKTALVEIYVSSQPGGGSDKIDTGNRFDSIPFANGMIKSGMSCQLVSYDHTKHDEFFEGLGKFDAVVVRCNPGQINAAGGDQQKFDDSMMKLAQRIPVWPTPDVMTKMGAKDALCKIRDMDFGLKDTFGYYEPEDIKVGFKKTIAFQPRVVKQNRGSAGEGIWIIKLKSGEYCKHFGDKMAADDDMLVLTEACDNHTEEHTVAEFLEFCTNGRTDKSGEWKSIGKGKYFEGGKEAGGQMVDQRFLPKIEEGEARFMMVGTELYRIEHYVYIGGVGGETKTTIYPPDAPEFATVRAKLEAEVPAIMKALGLPVSALPLLWAADFIPVDDHVTPYVIGEFNCSCLGISGFLAARGKTMAAVAPEDAAAGQAMCDLIGTKALAAVTAFRETLKLYYFGISPPSCAIRLFLESADIPHIPIVVNMFTQEHKKEPYLSVNPVGKVPAIQHNGLDLAESAAILVYLAQAYKKTEWYPEHPKVQARVNQWFSWHHTATFNAAEDVLVPKFRSGKVRTDRVKSALAHMEAALAVEGPFLAGASITIADLLISCYVEVLYLLKIPNFDDYPKVSGWLSAVKDKIKPEVFAKVNAQLHGWAKSYNPGS